VLAGSRSILLVPECDPSREIALEAVVVGLPMLVGTSSSDGNTHTRHYANAGDQRTPMITFLFLPFSHSPDRTAARTTDILIN
jgi:hypothetical protein